jgi:hypothetical protein
MISIKGLSIRIRNMDSLSTPIPIVMVFDFPFTNDFPPATLIQIFFRIWTMDCNTTIAISGLGVSIIIVIAVKFATVDIDMFLRTMERKSIDF